MHAFVSPIVCPAGVQPAHPSLADHSLAACSSGPSAAYLVYKHGNVKPARATRGNDDDDWTATTPTAEVIGMPGAVQRIQPSSLDSQHFVIKQRERRVGVWACCSSPVLLLVACSGSPRKPFLAPSGSARGPSAPDPALPGERQDPRNSSTPAPVRDLQPNPPRPTPTPLYLRHARPPSRY